MAGLTLEQRAKTTVVSGKVVSKDLTFIDNRACYGGDTTKVPVTLYTLAQDDKIVCRGFWKGNSRCLNLGEQVELTLETSNPYIKKEDVHREGIASQMTYWYEIENIKLL